MPHANRRLSPNHRMAGAVALILLSSNAAAKPPVKTGSLNPMLANLYYETQTLKGYTTTKGQFRYRAGETVTLSYAGVTIATVSAAPIITPLYLSDPGAARNQLHLLQALDTNSIKPGIQLPRLAMTKNPPVDFGSGSEVAAVLAALKPGAELPAGDAAADEAQLARTGTALASVPTRYNSATYNSYYVLDEFARIRPPAPQPAAVSSATVTFNAAFTLINDAPRTANGAPFSGKAQLTLSDGSTPSFDFTAASGDVAIAGVTLHYLFHRRWDAPNTGRTIALALYNGDRPVGSTYLQEISLRDPAKKNMPPRTGYVAEIGVPVPNAAPISHVKLCADCNTLGSRDPDGRVTSIHWETSAGDAGDGPIFEFDRYLGQQITVTQEITDDEGLKAVKKETFGKPLTLTQAVGLLAGKTWLESSDSPQASASPAYDYYYRLSDDNKKIVEIEVAKDNSGCSVTDNIAVSSVESGLRYAYFTSVKTFVYEGPDELTIAPVVTWTYTQQPLPGVCGTSTSPR